MKISLITASFNNASTIETTLKSVFSQTSKNIEYIVIDGKSTDKTIEILEEYKTRISIIVSEPDNGIYDALNKGISLASGEIIGFLHADDFFADESVIENVLKVFDEQNPDSVYGDLQYVSSENPDKIIRHWGSGNFSEKKLRRGWMPPHPATFITKEIYEKYGKFNTDYKIAADYESILRFFGQAGISTFYLPKVLVKMRTGGASNKNLNNIILKMKEDYRALKSAKMGGIFTLLLKNLRKISQLFVGK
jgi:glycosyltransferase